MIAEKEGVGTSADRRSRRGSLLLGGVSLLFCVAVAECFVRAFYPCPWYGYEMSGWQRGLFRLDPMLGKRGVPGVRGRFASRDFDVEVSFDAEGNRSRVPAFAPGRRNFVALGDSFTWGWGVEDHEVWSEQLMRLDPELNVYNLGIPGTGTDQHYLLLADYLERHPAAMPEAVILIVSSNDFRDVLRDEQGRIPKPRFVWEKGDLKLVNVPIPARYASRFAGRYDPGEPRTSFVHRSHLHNLLNRGIPKLLRSKRRTHEVTPQEGGALVQELIRRIRNTARMRGAELRVALLDFGGHREPFRELESFLAAEEITFVGFRSRRIPQRQLWLDGHLSAKGQRDLAEAIRGLLD